MKYILTDKKHKRVPSKMNPKRPTPRHIIQKMAEVGERILKATRPKTESHIRNSNKATT